MKTMKRIVALVFAVLLAVSLFTACNKPASDETSASPSQSAAAQESTAPESAAPQESAAHSDETDVSPAASSTGYWNGPDWIVDPAPPHGDVGWYTDDVDWFARDPYKIAFIYSQAFALTDMESQSFKRWSERVNFEYAEFNGNQDNELFLNHMEVCASQGWEGMILQPDATIGIRVDELADELGIAWMPGVTPIVDEDNNLLQPMVTLGTKYQADLANDFLIDNYKTYWGDIEIDPSTLGYMCLTIASNPILKAVYDYSLVGIEEAYPGVQIFDGDCINFGVSADAGYQVASATMAAHPEIEHWFITTVLEDYAQGAAQAASSLDIEDKVLICSNGANILIPLFEQNAAGKSWVSGVYYAQDIFCEPLVCGVIAMLDGRATPESLYPEWKAPGATYANILCETKVVTKETYQDYLDYIDEYVNGNFN